MSRQSENRAKKEIQVGFEVKDSRQADKLAAKWQKNSPSVFLGRWGELVTFPYSRENVSELHLGFRKTQHLPICSSLSKTPKVSQKSVSRMQIINTL
jgi:hypothetical protein